MDIELHLINNDNIKITVSKNGVSGGLGYMDFDVTGTVGNPKIYLEATRTFTDKNGKLQTKSMTKTFAASRADGFLKGIGESSPIHSINGCNLGEWKFTFYVEALNTAGSRQKIKTQPGSITLA